MEFACIGFDVRIFPSQSYPSADYSEWERDERVFSALGSACNVLRNEYSLLTIVDQQKMREAVDYISNRATNCDLVAIEMPRNIVISHNMKFGLNNSVDDLDLSAFACCGLDVCDIDGLYSCFNHPEIVRFRCDYGENTGLIPETNIEFALEVAQYANFLDPHHRPFVITKVSSLKCKGKAEKSGRGRCRRVMKSGA